MAQSISWEEKQTLFAHAQSQRKHHEAEINEAFSLSFPQREIFRTEHSQNVDTGEIYDTTATQAVRNYVNTNMRLLVPQSLPWVSVKLRTPELERKFSSQFAARIKTINDTIFQHYTNSNFYLALGEALTDCAVAGTGCIATYNDPFEGISYSAVPLHQLYFLDDKNSFIDVTFREHKLTGRQLLRMWGDVMQLTRSQREDLEQNPTAKHQVLESCINTADREWEYCVDLRATGDVLNFSLGPHSQFRVFRESKANGETWGYSNFRHCLPDIRALNIIMQDLLIDSNFAAKPLLFMRDMGIPAKQLQELYQPGGVITGEEKLEIIYQGQGLQAHVATLERLQNSVRAMMYDNALNSNPNQPTYQTAQEVTFRRDMFYQNVGQVAQRFAVECLQPQAKDDVERMIENGIIEIPSKDEIMGLGEPGVETFYDLAEVSVNAAIQRALSMTEAQSAVQSYLTVAQTLNDPAVMSKIVDVEKFARKVLNGFGFDPALIRTEAQAQQFEAQLREANMAAAAQGILSNAPPQPQSQPILPMQGGMQ